MESSQKLIVNQTDRSLVIKCTAALFFTAFQLHNKALVEAQYLAEL